MERLNFQLSNVFAKTSVGGTYNSGTMLFIDKITNNPTWTGEHPASTQTQGIEITNFSNH